MAKRSKAHGIAKLVVRDGLVRNDVVATFDSDQVVSIVGENASMAVYTTAAELPTSGLTAGNQAFITSTGRLYISNSVGWYNIALINQTPYWIEQPDGSYTLSTTGASTVITILATDSDGTIPSYTATADSDFNLIATITTDSEGTDGTRFIITPLDSEGGTAVPGTGTLTFIATDGTNQASVVSTFSLSFGPDWTATPTESKLTASDGAASDGFGSSVSFNSDATYFIAGSPNDDDGDTNDGSAYIYTRSGSTWTQQQKITASVQQLGDAFGRSVSLNSDATYAIVGATGAGGDGQKEGRAWVFTRSGSTWTEQAQLAASDLQISDQFGYSVSLNSDATYAIVGAPFEDGGAGNPSNNNGAAYIYYRVGSSWSQQARLPSFTNAANAYFGESVSMSSDGTYVAVGARGRYYSPSNLPGLVYIYTRSGSTWTLQAELVASDNQTQDFFGKSISMNPDATYIIIGAQGEDTGGSDAGAAYIFTRSGSTWTQQAKIVSSDLEANDYFGYNVSINSDGTFAVVGAHGEDGGAGNPISSAGALYTFKRTGSTWTQQAKLTASDASTNGGYFAMATSISGDGKYIAASGQYFNSSAGAAYIYEAG